MNMEERGSSTLGMGCGFKRAKPQEQVPEYFDSSNWSRESCGTASSTPNEGFSARSSVASPTQQRSLSQKQKGRSGEVVVFPFNPRGAKGCPLELEAGNLPPMHLQREMPIHFSFSPTPLPLSHEEEGRAAGKQKAGVKPPRTRLPRRKAPRHQAKQCVITIANLGDHSPIIADHVSRTKRQVKAQIPKLGRKGSRKGRFSPGEDNIILTMFQTIGPNWIQIAKHLPNRTSTVIKNRFYRVLKAKTTNHDSSIISSVPGCTKSGGSVSPRVTTTEAISEHSNKWSSNPASEQESPNPNGCNLILCSGEVAVESILDLSPDVFDFMGCNSGLSLTGGITPLELNLCLGDQQAPTPNYPPPMALHHMGTSLPVMPPTVTLIGPQTTHFDSQKNIPTTPQTQIDLLLEQERILHDCLIKINHYIQQLEQDPQPQNSNSGEISMEGQEDFEQNHSYPTSPAKHGHQSPEYNTD